LGFRVSRNLKPDIPRHLYFTKPQTPYLKPQQRKYMSRKSYKCVVSYKGSAYHGWQRQEKQVTVQGMIEFALLKFFGGEIKIYGASRTDAGVHAYGQVFSFQLATRIPAQNIKRVLNDLLPADIRIMDCREEEGFHARWNVRKKFYRYLIHNTAIKYPLYTGLCWQLDAKLDLEKMRSILSLFKGKKDYRAFSGSGTQHKEFMRTVDSIRIRKQGKWVIIDFMAKSFLYNMIRKITAALVSYGMGEMSRHEIEQMFKTGDRSINRHMAPGEGLYLVKIIYASPESGVRSPESRESPESGSRSPDSKESQESKEEDEE
jgi:tRNA pseudouridine38-40 synthase